MNDTVDVCDCDDSPNAHVHVLQIRDVAHDELISLEDRTNEDD